MPSQLWTADALYDASFDDPPAVIAPILKTNTTVLLYGPRGSGKTQLLLEVARAVSSGGLFLNQFKCRQGPVVFVEADMTAQELQECLALNNTLKGLPIHFITFDKRPDMVKLAKEKPTIFQEHLPVEPVLVVFDTLNKMHRLPSNEDSTAPTVYEALRTLFPKGAHLLAGHDRKEPPPQQGWSSRTRYEEESFRGSSAWLDDAAGGWHLVRDYSHKASGEFRSRLVFTKVRGVEPAPMSLCFHEDSLIIKPAELTARQHALQFLEDHPGTTTQAGLVKFLLALTNEAGKPLCRRATAYSIAKELLGSGDEV